VPSDLAPAAAQTITESKESKESKDAKVREVQPAAEEKKVVCKSEIAPPPKAVSELASHKRAQHEMGRRRKKKNWKRRGARAKNF
jgi:hypothetical protein